MISLLVLSPPPSTLVKLICFYQGKVEYNVYIEYIFAQQVMSPGYAHFLCALMANRSKRFFTLPYSALYSDEKGSEQLPFIGC